MSHSTSFELAPARIDDVRHPISTTAVLGEHRIVNPLVSVPLFEDDAWDLAAIETDPGKRVSPITFTAWPSGFKTFAKHVTYALLNHGTPTSLLETPSSNYVPWPSVPSIQHFLSRLRLQVEWLVEEWSASHPDTPVRTPADLDAEHLNEVRRWTEQQSDGQHGINLKLEGLIRVWYLNPLIPDNVQWPEPEWRHSNWKQRRFGEENRTERIPQATMGPLLEWAVSFVTNFAEDILGADEHYRRRLAQISPADSQKARALFDEYLRDGWALPLNPLKSKSLNAVGWASVSYRHGIAVEHLPVYYRRHPGRGAIPLDGKAEATALDFKLRGSFHGQAWAPSIGVYDVLRAQGDDEPGPLLVHLRTACMIVCAYLTGARPDEVLHLEHGAARDPILTSEGGWLQLIDGRVWKGVRREPDGRPGQPKPATWATAPVAATAIHVAERINQATGRNAGPLFARTNTRAWTNTATAAITNFVQFVNTRLVPHSVNPAALFIPIDPSRKITLRRFRRTLAWFISNRANGEVSLAVQYQHLADTMANGYAGTKESGMRDLLLEEDWAHRRRTIRHLGMLLEDGQTLSGPAAQRASDVAQSLPRFLTPADERRLRRSKDLVIYDNPSALALCVYDESSALCEKRKLAGKDTAPTLLECVEGCPCIARTEAHLATLRRDAELLRAQAELVPRPMSLSMLARADRHDRIVEESEHMRISGQPSQTVDGTS